MEFEIVSDDEEFEPQRVHSPQIVEDDNARPEIGLGMIFSSAEEFYEHFKSYARFVGFPLKKRDCKKGSDGVVNYGRYSCSRQGETKTKGSNSLKPRPVDRIRCKVAVSAKLERDGKWHISNCFLDHTHLNSPSKWRLFACNRGLSEKEKQDIAMREAAGVKIGPNFNVGVEERGGFENTNYIARDCRNYVDKLRWLKLGKGDAQAIQEYFIRMQTQNPDFYFSTEVDEEGRLENVFWADARSRLAYKEFGEVVTFDTTYLVNKYNMPFAPFVGVNHHGQSILFGWGLVSHETTETFTWLFQTWLRCMGGKAPRGIITDQDRAMQGAIVDVFPNTVHRWCMWHILKKVPEKLNGYTAHQAIARDLHDAVYDSQRPQDFEESWITMIDKWNLLDNMWLSGLYDERRRWVPTYVKTTFWAGMSTTQRSESMNAYFDYYVNWKTTLKQFVEKYDLALRGKIEKEVQEDCRSMNKVIPTTTHWKMEKQIQSVYTIMKFKEFQNELNGIVYTNTVSMQPCGNLSMYGVKDRIAYADDLRKDVIFSVTFNPDLGEVECSCHLFEYRGTLCRHVINVLLKDLDLDFIPEKYILKRWRKDVKRPHSRYTVADNGWVVTPEYKRHNRMSLEVHELMDLASFEEEDTNSVVEWARNKKREIRQHTSQVGTSNSQFIPHKIIEDVEIPSQDTIIGDPTGSRRKGRPGPTRRLLHPGQVASNKQKKRKEKATKSATVPRRGNTTTSEPISSNIEEVTPTQESTCHYPQYDPYHGNFDEIGAQQPRFQAPYPTYYPFMDPTMGGMFDGGRPNNG